MNKTIKRYLMWVGWFLVILGGVGYLLPSTLAPSFYFTQGENIAHLVLGVFMLLVAKMNKDVNTAKWFTALVGVVGLYFAVFSWAVSPDYYGYAQLDTLDNVIHLVVGLWALWIVWGRNGKKK